MFKVGNLVAVKSYYKTNTWTDVFKIIKVNFDNQTVDIYWYATNKGQNIFKGEFFDYHGDQPFDKFILIPELNKNRSTHFPKWW